MKTFFLGLIVTIVGGIIVYHYGDYWEDKKRQNRNTLLQMRSHHLNVQLIPTAFGLNMEKYHYVMILEYLEDPAKSFTK